MIRIAHRGNYAGRNEKRENSPDYIQEAIAAGYNVEVDVWLIEENWYLGHDLPKYLIERSFLERPEIWTHAKNLVGYVSLYNNPKAHVFWHNKDEYVFTSKGIKWALTGVATNDGIVVMPENSFLMSEWLMNGDVVPLGVCSDDFALLKGMVI